SFVVGIACWYLLKNREKRFAVSSIKIGAIVGLFAGVMLAITGDGSAYQVAQKQPMKLAAMEGLYEGKTGAGLVAAGVLNPDKKSYNDGVDPFLFKIELPGMLSFFAERDLDSFVPGIKDIIGGYTKSDGTIVPSLAERIDKGKLVQQALTDYGKAKAAKDEAQKQIHRKTIQDNINHFGYGYMTSPEQLIPPVGLTFYSFHIMVILGGYFILFFLIILILIYKKEDIKPVWLKWVALISIPAAYITSQLGWVVAEVGRQPWAIQDILPTFSAISKIPASSVQITFFLFLIVFTALLIAELRIMIKQIKTGPEFDLNAKN
ncbi:MAG: cytochrome ubiquinol oxidase subunit I, partial [Bacteroidales bacterium]|nr:cytochrome ubiquinol oxidase subunit I [Bacteroidales bacterium]